jgi:murein DD-endopeptidase MepM/ murein hydrolase activator NlpD
MQVKWFFPIPVLALALSLGLTAGRDAAAITTPITGGVSLPEDFEIRLPFHENESAYITAGYSPSGGSSLHATTNEPYQANDYYALDFTLPDYPSDGLGQPVLAVASGTVVLAGWATAGWANYGLRVVVEHDYNADGHRYVTIYCHLNAIYVSEGDPVVMGTEVGEMGDSCEETLSCPHFGTHLHFAMHRDSTIGGSGTGGSYGGNAVVPEPFDGYEDLVRGMTLVSHNNGGGPVPVCEPLPAGGGILDDRSPCFVKGGSPTYWHYETAGWDGNLIWTTATADAAPDNWGRWNILLSAAGTYTVEAYTDAAFARSRRALYEVQHDGATDSARVDQTAADGWNPVGAFDFSTGGEQFVLLNDNTGEPVADGVQLVFDAIRLTPGTGPRPDEDAMVEADAVPDGLPDMPADAAPDTEAADLPAPDAGTDAGSDAETDVEWPGLTEGGCACSLP